MLLRLLIILPLLALLANTAGANPAVRDSMDPELRQLLADAIDSSDSFNDRFDAEVWLFDMSSRMEPFVNDEEFRLDLLKNIHREATRVELPPELVIAVIEIESRFDTFAISRSGAQGLMQVMPHMMEPLGLAGNAATIESNIEAGCWILANNIRRLGEEQGISSYFWGSDIRGSGYLRKVQAARDEVRRQLAS